MSVRRGKWHPPPPPTPRILHLPRRSSRRSRTAAAARPVTGRLSLLPARSPPEYIQNPRGRLDALFDQDRFFNGERRARVETSSPSGRNHGDSEEERWKFQAEVLRAECNFLRMERQVALRKLEISRAQMEAALRSAVETLVSEREKLDGGQSLRAMLEDEIEELGKNLEVLQRGRRKKKSSGRCRERDLDHCRKSSNSNFDRKARLLRKRLEEMSMRETKQDDKKVEDAEEDEKTCVREIREIAGESIISISAEKEEEERGGDGGLVSYQKCRFPDVEMLRRKMEGMSKVMLERVEGYYSVLSWSSSSSSSSAAAAASSRAEVPQVARALKEEEEEEVDKGCCTGRCREVVGRIVEQVRAEMEQWSEMQRMLEPVRNEMEDLQCSRDFWERCAVVSDHKLRTLNTQMLEWRQRAVASEHKVFDLQRQVSELQAELVTLRGELFNSQLAPSTRAQPHMCSPDRPRRIKCQHLLFQQQQLHKEKEKRVLICRLNESTNERSQLKSNIIAQPRRPPLREIGNLSQLSRA